MTFHGPLGRDSTTNSSGYEVQSLPNGHQRFPFALYMQHYITTNPAHGLAPLDSVYNWATFPSITIQVQQPQQPKIRPQTLRATEASESLPAEPSGSETPGGERDGRRRRRGWEAGAAPGSGAQALPSLPPRRRRPLQGRPPHRGPRRRQIRWYRAAPLLPSLPRFLRCAAPLT